MNPEDGRNIIIQAKLTKKGKGGVKPTGSLGDLNQTTYHLVHFEGANVRLVQPYIHDYETRYKERWKGKTLLEVYETEFSSSVPRHNSNTSSSDSYFQSAIKAGFIRINGEQSAPERVIVTGDRISRLSHRHEPPVVHVSGADMVTHDDGDLVVVNKPGSLPVHPTGAYRFNTLLYVLAVERPDLGELRTIHRLDRLTSGLVVFARTSQGAQHIANAIQSKDGLRARKTYVALVVGKFPSSKEEIDAKQSYPKDSVRIMDDQEQSRGLHPWVSVSFPLSLLDAHNGVHVCDEFGGKESHSRFTLLSYNSIEDKSLIKCEPITGRTHQLRLHLQLVGHPISNDPNYGMSSRHNEEEEEEEEGVTIDSARAKAFAALCEKALTEPAEGGCARVVMVADTARMELVKNLCIGCAKSIEPMRHKEIFLHSCRFRVYRRESGLCDLDFRVPLPGWAGCVQDEFWND